MYRHILVPIDDSPLSIATARKAVALARALGSKVTFFHAQADSATSSVGGLEHMMAPGSFNDETVADASAILAKAQLVARAAGVDYDAFALTSNRPYEAILGAAAAKACDLIFMASHGRRGIEGLMLGSQTHKVLQHAAIPVLVSTVESNVADFHADAQLAIF